MIHHTELLKQIPTNLEVQRKRKNNSAKFEDPDERRAQTDQCLNSGCIKAFSINQVSAE